jgi:hypothetical protein
MNRKRRRWLIVIALLLVLGSSGAWWFQARQIPKFTFEPPTFKRGATGMDRMARVLIQNDTGAEFSHYYGSGDIRVKYQLPEGAGWTQPTEMERQFMPGPDEGGTRIGEHVGPGERLELFVARKDVFGPARPRAPYQVGVCVYKRPTKWMRQLDGWLGGRLPRSLLRSREIWIWSETITP